MSTSAHINRVKDSRYWADGSRFTSSDMASVLRISTVRMGQVLGVMVANGDLRRLEGRRGDSCEYAKPNSGWLRKPWRQNSNESLGVTW